jgi:hypothetical protein
MMLAIFKDGEPAPVQVVSPVVYLNGPDDMSDSREIVFEVLEQDARDLFPLIGSVETYALDTSIQALARLETLEPSKSPHSQFAQPDCRVLRGVLKVIMYTAPRE